MRKEETVDHHIRAVWHAISRMYNQQAGRHDITTAIGFVLLNIHGDDGTPATKIAPLMGLESRSLTRMLKTMEERKLIYRVPDPQDKRSVRIFLTDLGKSKKEVSREVVLLFNNKVQDQVSPQKLKIFFDVMMSINRLAAESAHDSSGKKQS